MNTTVKAVIFDFDGLIVDTETPWYEAFQEIYVEHGLELPIELWLKGVGGSLHAFDPYEDLRQKSNQPLERTEIKRRFQQKFSLRMENAPLLPGVEAYLREAKQLKLKIAIASSSPYRWIEPYLQKHDISHYFDEIITSDQVAAVKPDPELFQLALQKLQVNRDEALVFEDSLNGFLSAKAAGIRCIIVPNPITAHLAFPDCDLILNAMTDRSLSDVIEAIK